MSYILHLETATKSCSVALSFEGKLIALKEVVTDDFSHSENLTLFVQDVLSQANIEMNKLAAVSVASGPGSYTGLRIGVSTAKGFCYALGIPLIAVDSLTSIASIAQKKHSGLSIVAMFDARRREVYSAIFDPDLNFLKPISADVLDQQSYKEFEPFLLIGDGAQKMLEEWEGRSFVFDPTIFASASGQIEIAYQKFLTKSFEDVAYFEPFYLKDFMITQAKKV